MGIDYRTATEARQVGQLDAWRASHRENIRVRDVIDAVISEKFDGMHLAADTVKNVLFNADAERVALVLVATMQERVFDGRFSQASRTWAAGVKLPAMHDGIISGYSMYACRTHSTILEGFIKMFRRETEGK